MGTKRKTPRSAMRAMQIKQAESQQHVLDETYTLDPPTIRNAADVVGWLAKDLNAWLYTAVSVVEHEVDRDLAVQILLDLINNVRALVRCLDTGVMPVIQDCRDEKRDQLLQAAKVLLEGDEASEFTYETRTLITAAQRGFELEHECPDPAGAGA